MSDTPPRNPEGAGSFYPGNWTAYPHGQIRPAHGVDGTHDERQAAQLMQRIRERRKAMRAYEDSQPDVHPVMFAPLDERKEPEPKKPIALPAWFYPALFTAAVAFALLVAWGLDKLAWAVGHAW